MYEQTSISNKKETMLALGLNTSRDESSHELKIE